MAIYGQTSADAKTGKFWSNLFLEKAIEESMVGKFRGTVIKEFRDANKGGGDQVTFQLDGLLSGAGVLGGNALEGNEEAISLYSDSVTLNRLRNAARVPNDKSIDQQRNVLNYRTAAYRQLKKWYTERMNVAFFNQICGNTAETDTRYTGLTAVPTPDSDHIIRPSGSTDQGLSSGDTITLDVVDACIEAAQTLDPLIEPIVYKGRRLYVMFLHPYQVTGLRHDGSGKVQWNDIALASLQGGNDDMFTRNVLGVYRDVMFFATNRVPTGVHSVSSDAVGTVRRAAFCGANAACLAFGKGQKNLDVPADWVEKHFDYDEEVGVSVAVTMALKATQFDSANFANIVVPTYAAAWS